jgi:pilus assembly protein CpaB
VSRRIFAITIAVVLAALGTAGVLFLVLSADMRAQSRIGDAVTVAIATRRIPVGTTGARVLTDSMVRFEKMPKALVPNDTLSEIDAERARLVVTSNIAPGQMLLAANFDTASKVTSGLPLPEGKLAVTVETGAPEQVAGYVQAGSQVAIFLTYNVIGAGGAKTSLERTRILLPRVEVLAAGTYQAAQARNSATTTASRTASLMLTVAVDQADAERLIEGVSHGTLYLGLLTDSVRVEPGTGVDNTDGGGASSAPLFN